MHNRIHVLDFLRGIAVLGILIINIESFAYSAPFNPYLYGYFSEFDTTVRFAIYWFAQGKFFALFLILFGISFYLMLEKSSEKAFLEKPPLEKNSPMLFYSIYTRRLFFLFLIGTAHCYLIWSGDILHHYAICALLLLATRSFSQRALILFSLVLVSILLFNASQQALKRSSLEHAYQVAKATPSAERTTKMERQITSWERRLSKRSAERFATKQDAHQGSYLDLLTYRWNEIKIYRGELFFKSIVFDSLLLMTIGVVLFRSGIFTDYRQLPYYWTITFSLVLLGLITGYDKYTWWSFNYLNPITSVYQQSIMKLAPYIQGVSYLLLLNGCYQRFHWLKRLTLLNQVGKMALSSYIFQSIVAGIIFYGYGFGLHNQISRSNLLFWIAGIWLLNGIFCYLWLRYFKQGPLEYWWRRWSYPQPEKAHLG